MSIIKGKKAIELLNSIEEEEYDPLIIELKFGEAIANRGLSQREVARLTGLRPNAVSNLARGEIERLSLDHVTKIVRALNIEDINEVISINVESEVNGAGYRQEQERIEKAISDKKD